jgi:hypothetical protein
MKRSGTTNVYCVTTHAASPDVFVLYTWLMQNSNIKSALPNPLLKDYSLPLPFPLPLPLPNGSEKATPAND